MARRQIDVDGLTAYVSGAASGIGRAVALRLSAHGCPVAIVDQNEDGLRETEEAMVGPVLSRRVDVRDRQAMMALAAEVDEWAPVPLGMVFNNAGVTSIGSVADTAIEDDQWVIDVNFGGVVNGTRAFLPILLRQNSGVIVNTSSVFGLVGMPYQSAYCASKFAVRGFTDSLRAELRQTGVHAANVHPGGIKTNIARSARFHSSRQGETHAELSDTFDRIARTTPERAAEIIHAGVKAGKSRILVGPDAYMFDFFARAAPTRYQDVFARFEARATRASR